MRTLSLATWCLAVLLVTTTASANTILTTTAGDGEYLIGEVFVPGDLSGGQVTRDAAAVNGLLALDCLDCYSDTTSPSYYRSANDFGSLDAAVTAGAQVSGGSLVTSGNFAYLTLTQSYDYLIVTYDGPNGGATVWYIGGGTIGAGETLQFARYAYPTGTENVDQHLFENTSTTRYGITHWTLLNPTTSTSVPDGGATLLLLGSALIVIAVVQRRLRV